MSRQEIGTGVAPNSKDGDTLRVAFTKINDNFAELYALSGGADLAELAQDYAAAMLTNGVHSGVNVAYNDSTNRLNLTVVIDGGTATTTF